MQPGHRLKTLVENSVERLHFAILCILAAQLQLYLGSWPGPKLGHAPQQKESEMKRAIKSVLALALVAGVSACASPAPEQDDIIYIDAAPAPIQPDHVLNKYD